MPPTEEEIKAESDKAAADAKDKQDLIDARTAEIEPYKEFIPESIVIGDLTERQYLKVLKKAQSDFDAESDKAAADANSKKQIFSKMLIETLKHLTSIKRVYFTEAGGWAFDNTHKTQKYTSDFSREKILNSEK